MPHKPTLHVLTAVTRPRNLGALVRSLIPCDSWFNLVWHIDWDIERRFVGGQQLKNEMLDRIPADQHVLDWVWVLDDDNIAHQNFFEVAGMVIRKQPRRRAVVVSQQVSPTAIRMAKPKNMHERYVDAAQALLRRDLIGNHRFALNYSGDGILIQALHERHPNDFVFVQDALCYYNRLSW